VKTEALIVELVRRASPVTPLRRPLVRLLLWLAAMAPPLAFGMWLLGPRFDVGAALVAPVFEVRLAATLASAILAGFAALAMSVPGQGRSIALRVAPVAMLGAWALLLAALLSADGRAVERILAFPVNWPCPFKILGLSLLPAATLFALLQRAAPLEPARNAVFAALASTMLGAAATQLLCPVDDPAHQLVGHVAAVVVLAAVEAAWGAWSVGRRAPAVPGAGL
jgi:hypothetical protein